MLTPDLNTERAFREQARALDPILYNLALRLCRDPAVARDMVQDTFERGLKSLPRLPPRTNLRAWLTTVLHHRIVDHCRAQARHASVPLETVAEVAGESTDESWARVSNDEFLRALAQLPEKFRSVCELFLVERLSYEAIAHKLGISKNTVGTRLSRSKERLKALLRDVAEDVE